MGSPVVNYDDESITNVEEDEEVPFRSRRGPFHYPVLPQINLSRDEDMNNSAVYSRYRYYCHLDGSRESKLRIPDHVVPPTFFNPLVPFIESGEKQSSIVTIFAMWNCMVGTSLLSMPWAIHQAGFFGGVGCLITMGLICFYTAYRILNLQNLIGYQGDNVDFSDLCRHLLGRWAEWLSIGSSLAVLLGGAVVYWILMCNFLYHTAIQFYDVTGHNEKKNFHFEINPKNDVVCLLPIDSHNSSNLTLTETWTTSSNVTYDSTFLQVWDLYKTVPLFLIIPIVPLINFKSPTFFTKFNAFGTFSVLYLITFICIKGVQWNINASFSGSDSPYTIPYFKPSFTVMTGILALAYFIHNCIISITKNQRNPENNVRDIAIAFLLVAVTYLSIGVVFYLTFPLPKDCIDENLLNNFGTRDTLAFISRFFLLFQMMSVFPLILYIFRAHFLYKMFGNSYPGLTHVLILNSVIVAICILFAMFLPHIGTIIRFVGALCGFIYIFALPSLTYIAALNEKSIHAPFTAILHALLILIGFANLVSQFFS